MSGSSTIGVVGTTNVFGILRFLPITKDRKLEHKKLLSDKAKKHTQEYSPHAMTPRQWRQKKVCASVTHATHHKQIMNILQTLQREFLTLARHGEHHRTAPIIKHATQTNHSNSSITDRTTKIYSDIIGWQHIIG